MLFTIGIITIQAIIDYNKSNKKNRLIYKRKKRIERNNKKKEKKMDFIEISGEKYKVGDNIYIKECSYITKIHNKYAVITRIFGSKIGAYIESENYKIVLNERDTFYNLDNKSSIDTKTNKVDKYKKNDKYKEIIIKSEKQQIESKRLLEYNNNLLQSKFSNKEISYDKFSVLIENLNESVKRNCEKIYEIIELLDNLSDIGNDKVNEYKTVKMKKITDILNANEIVISELNICIINIFDLKNFNDDNKTSVDLIIKELERLYDIIKKF
jgi:hypothetical protein